MRRVGNDHFTFHQGRSTLDPGPGTIRDRDTVARAAQKLQVLYPEPLPSVVPMGAYALLPKPAPPSRPVRTVISAKGSVLVDDSPIGQQCLRTDFNKYFPPKDYFQRPFA